jgi:tetratricopeptide (TPR) repeat protein
MTKRLLLIIPVLLATGCTNHSEGTADRSAIPADAKFTDVKDPAINAETHYAAGNLAESMDQPAKAIQQYQAAVAIDPKHKQALYHLALLQTNAKDFPAALETWDKYLAATNYSAIAYANKALCYQMSDDYEKAEQTFKLGIERSPKDEMCRVNYGLMLARQGRMNDALMQLQVVLPPAAAHYNLGSIYEIQGKSAQAKMEYTRSLEADPTFFDSQQRLADLK